MAPRTAEIEAWVAAEMARRAVRALADATRELPVELLAFKGVHLAWCIADDPAYRPMADADVLVVSGSFASVVHRLERVPEFELTIRDWSTNCIRYLPANKSVDLHRIALLPAWGRLRRNALRRRAVLAPVLGPGVLVPDLADAAVLALANFVKNGFGEIEPSQAPADLALLADKGVTAVALAERLREHGLRRVGLVGMVALARRDARWAPYVDALGGDHDRARAAWFVRAIERAAAADPYAGLMVVRAVGDTPLSTVGSLAWGAARGVRDWARKRLR